MAIVEIYTTRICPYCAKAKQLLDSKGVTYKEFHTDEDPELAEEALKRSGGRKTVPQIFIDDNHVGGCDDLYALDGEGNLESLLKKGTESPKNLLLANVMFNKQ